LAARYQTTGLPVIPIHVDASILETGILDEIQATAWQPDVTIVELREQLEQLPDRISSPRDFLAAHHAWLRWQFCESPVLAQEPYSLKDVYIETECGQLKWGEINDGKPDFKVDAFQQAYGGRHGLVQTTLAMLENKDFRDLIVVQAVPGSGKSAFALRIANELLKQGFFPIKVRFRDLRLATFPDVGELIDDAIRIGDSDDDSPNANAPIVKELLGHEHEFHGFKQCKTVFIIDGWDEVSLTGNVSYQAQLKEWLPKLRQYFIDRRGAPVRVILTGRPSAEVGSSGVLHKTTPVLTMRPIQPQQLREYANQVHAKLVQAASSARPAGWSLDLERLNPVFESYDQWFMGFEKGENPRRSAATEVLGNPLLAYLSLRVLADSSVDIAEVLKEPTALYFQLIKATVRHAGKGEDPNLTDAVHRGGQHLRYLLHEVASTISILRSESVSYAELASRFEDQELPIRRDVLQGWSGTADCTENALRELVVNFYFKGGNTALGCEFLHKSFREYLFAEAIYQALLDAVVSSDPREPIDNRDDAYARDFPPNTIEFNASRRLAYLLAPQWLSPEVETHLRWLLQQETSIECSRLSRVRDLLVSLYAWWAEGVHLRHQASNTRRQPWNSPYVDQLFTQVMPFDDPKRGMVPIRTTSLDAHLGHALVRMACITHSLVSDADVAPQGRRVMYQHYQDGRVYFRPGAGRFMATILARINAEGWRRIPFGGLLSGPLDLRDEVLELVHGAQIDLSGSLLAQSQLPAAWLHLAQLSGCDLQNCSLFFAKLEGANLKGSNLSGADLGRANLSGANLSGANLSGSNLGDADLSNANLSGANLSGANLRRANLRGVDLSRVDLSEADSNGAQLDRMLPNLRRH
jgi:hypothetical protein